MRQRAPCEFLSRWLDIAVDGIPLKEWCEQLKDDPGKAFCSFCKVAIKFDRIGVRTLKDHGGSLKHKENRLAALSVTKKKESALQHQLPQPKEATEALSVIPPGTNLNCVVDLSPLTIDINTSFYKVKKPVSNPVFPPVVQTWNKPETKNPFIDVFICFYCGEEFSSRPTLQGHQYSCDMKPPELQAVTPPGKAVLSRHDCPASPLPPLLCLHQEGESGMQTPTKDITVYPYIRPSKESYISGLGLLPKKKAAQVCKRRRNTECESIDLDDDIPISPTMPRTPKLLISHLSRDGSENSGPNSSPFRRRRSLFSTQTSRMEKDGNDNVMEGDEVIKEETQDEEKPKMHSKSLYSLDLTSPLGQFVIKHVKGDPNLHVLSDVESHCLTSTPKKSAAAIRLRERHITYPVTFRGYSGKFFVPHVHQYKFTQEQKKEFMRRVNTGLDQRSRALARKMKPFKVRLTYLTKADLKRWMPARNEIRVDLKPLTAEEIAFWTSPKPVPISASSAAAVFPSGLTFSSPNVNNVLGLRTRQDVAFFNRCHLSVANYVSEETFAEVTANRRAVYKSLLSDSCSSESGSSEVENSVLQTPPSSVLRQILSKPVSNATLPRQDNPLPDITNLKVDLSLNNSLKYGVLSPVSNSSDSQLDKSSSDDGRKGCSFLSRVNRSISCSSSNTSIGYCSSKCSSYAIASKHDAERLTGESNSTPLRSNGRAVEVEVRDTGEGKKIISEPNPSLSLFGGHTVSVKNTEEGKKIKTLIVEKSAENGGGVRRGSSSSSRCSSNSQGKGKSMPKQSVSKHRNIKNISSTRSAQSNSRKRPLGDCNHASAPKKEKLENGSLTKQSLQRVQQVTSPTGKYQLATSRGKSLPKSISSSQAALELGKPNPALRAGITRAARAVKKAVRRLSRESAGVTGQRRASGFFDKSGMKAACKIVNDEKNETQKKASGVCIVVQNGEKVLNGDSKAQVLHVDKPSNPRSSISNTVERQTTTDENPLPPSLSGVILNGGTAAGMKCIRNSSISRKTRHVAYINSAGDSSEDKDTENLDINASGMDNGNKKTGKNSENFVLQTSTCRSPNSKQGSHKHRTLPSKLKFVSYSSPHSPQLRRSSLRKTMSVTQRAEERKSLLSSFLLEAHNKKPNAAHGTSSQPKLTGSFKANSVKEKLRQNPERGRERR